MALKTSVFKLVDHNKEAFLIRILDTLKDTDVDSIRQVIRECLESDYQEIYMNLSEVRAVDQYGVNEIMNAHTLLKTESKHLTLVIKKGSEIEQWVKKMELGNMISLAILPAI